MMQKSVFIHATEVAEELGVSNAHAYKLIRELNMELSKKGFLIIRGRISKQYFNERVYGRGKGGE